MNLPQMALRAELNTWLGERWDPQRTVRDWWQDLADSGWAFPGWPVGLGGRDLGSAATAEVAAVLAEVGVLGPPTGLGQLMGAPVVLKFGTPEQRQRWVPALARGAESWCQLFSEPGAGSDLAGVRTRAERGPGGWIVNGQKVWTSNADISRRGMLLARTNGDVPKHRGITYFIVDLDQRGVEIRPLRQMDGNATFSEVFLQDVVMRDEDVVGTVDDGWRVALATLEFERAGLSGGGTRGGLPSARPGVRAGDLDLTVGEVLSRHQQTREADLAMAGATTSQAMIELAREYGRSHDPVLRQRLIRFHINSEVIRLTRQRALSAAAQGQSPGPETSVLKLAMGALSHESRDLAYSIMGSDAMLAGADAPHGGRYQQMGLRAHRTSIAGGSDQVQRNIIGERVLGLPREPQVDRDVPFNRVAN